jgi:large subunit ribosomal protein L18
LAKGPQYNLPFRRRREGRTHYGKREKLVKSGIARFVIRPTNKHLGAQIIQAKPEGDFVLASAHSSELKEFGWKAPCGNMPAAYLTGLLAGRRAKANGVSEAILDIGLYARGPGSRIFAAAKGALNAGLTIPHEETVLPKAERIKGQHVSNYSKQLSSAAETHKKRFSVYLKHKLKPEDLPDLVAQVEAKINASQQETSK